MIRTLDIILALSALIVISPVFLTLIVILRFTGEGEIFYRQMRIGRQQKVFYVLKFATMLKNSPSMGLGTITVQNDSRILPLGHFLRKTKINELPQLLNVILGDMSLVGPRPLLMEYLPLYSTNQSRRHDIRPGITGWAQVNGRNTIYWGDRFRYVIWYVEDQSFILDMKIIWITIKKVITREGVSANGEATMPKFTGNKE